MDPESRLITAMSQNNTDEATVGKCRAQYLLGDDGNMLTHIIKLLDSKWPVEINISGVRLNY